MQLRVSRRGWESEEEMRPLGAYGIGGQCLIADCLMFRDRWVCNMVVTGLNHVVEWLYGGMILEYWLEKIAVDE